MATRSLGTLTLNLIAKIGGFVEGMGKAARVTDKRARQIEKRIRQTSDIAGKALKTISVGVVAAVAGLAGAVHKLGDAVDSMKQIGDLATGLGVNVGKFSALVEMMDDLGVNAQGTGVLIATLERNLVTAAGGSKTMAQAFKTLGVDIEGTNKPFAVLLEMATEISKNGLTSQTAAALTRLFGSQAKTLGVLLQQGPEAIIKATQDMLRSGQAFNAEGYKAAVDYFNAVDSIGDSFTALTRKLVVSVAPTLVSLAKTVQDNVDKFSAWLTTNDRVANAAKTLVKWVKLVANNIKLITAGFAALFALSILPKIVAVTKAIKAMAVAAASLDAALLPVAAVLAAVAGGIVLLTAKYVSHKRAVAELKKQQDLVNQAMQAAKKISDASAKADKNLVPYINNVTKANKERAKSALSVAQAARAANMAEINKLQRGVGLHVDPLGRRTGALARQEQRAALQRGIQTASPTVARQMQATLDAINKAYDPKRDAAMIARLQGLQKDQQALQDAMLKVSLGIAKVGNTTTAAVSGGAGTISADAKKRAAELKALQDKMRSDDVAGIKKEIAAEGKRLDAVNAVKDALATQ